MSANSLQQFVASALVKQGAARNFKPVVRQFKTGQRTRHGIERLSRKEYGLRHNLKGQALKRAYADYNSEFGEQLNRPIAAELASGKYLATKLVPMSHGFSAVFVTRDSIAPKQTVKPSALEKALQTLAAAKGIDRAMLENMVQICKTSQS